MQRCPICDSNLIAPFLVRGSVPVHQNLVMADRISAIEINRGNLTLAVCEDCGFIFNQDFDGSKLSYGKEYDNTQTYSPSFESYISELARSLIYDKNVQNCSVVEVGCGKGSFLRKLVESEEWGNTGYGFDPSYVGAETVLDGRLKFEKRYYDSECANIHADVVVCRHVIEHVPDPLNLLFSVRQALVYSPNARVFFETPCVEWILRNQVIWDFFYEHCSYFTAESLATAFEESGFQVESVEHIFEGQYLWLEATIPPQKPAITKKPALISTLANEFATSERELISKWEIKIQELASQGKVALWGAGAKGVTFANIIDPDRKWIDCIIDLNPNKQGKYIPGAAHPIVSYQDIADRGITTAILMNPNYHQENLVLLKASNLNIDLLVE
ncbi:MULTISPECIES: class I SAM-dependent methyltransferase [unclassified Microcoleus]|uniref:class I SAM-dependent methyltransferase n=1 Tax=unclassified Microcoleus TaxID=2642155 RepID=UPI0025E3535D|nr:MULTISPECIES: class I SAM-dependent methyltransferase [unclassified Microcoleus]